MKNLSVAISLKPRAVLFCVIQITMPYKGVLTLESLDVILNCDHSNEN